MPEKVAKRFRGFYPTNQDPRTFWADMQGSDSTRMFRMIILNIRQNILAGLVD